MKNLYESILSSTRTGIRGMIMQWMEEMNFLSNASINTFVFDPSKYKNTEDIIKISKKGKIDIPNDVSGSITLYNPYISHFNANVQFPTILDWCLQKRCVSGNKQLNLSPEEVLLDAKLFYDMVHSAAELEDIISSNAVVKIGTYWYLK